MDKIKLSSYRDLIVWQKSIELVVLVYDLTDKFPREEIYGLTSQLRRAAVSVPSNIAEGRYRGTRKDFRQFLLVAFASCAELETQIEIAKRLKKTNTLDYKQVDVMLLEVSKMLNSMIIKLADSR
jgi:four helix bundle protein